MDLHTIANDPAIIGLAAVALADTVVAVAVAIREGTFSLHRVGQFVGTHLLGRVLPIGVLLVLGYASEPLAGVAALAVVAYVTETIASIKRNLYVPEPDAAA